MTMTVRPSGVYYPYFDSETIKPEISDYDQEIVLKSSANNPYYVQRFPFKTKGKRKDDLIIFESDHDSNANVFLLENPLNRKYTSKELLENDGKRLWKKIFLQNMHRWHPISCIICDISGNGFNDAITIDRYVDKDRVDDEDNLQSYEGRVSWLENFGTDEGDWTRRDIGQYSGLKSLQVGHFTTTYSLQVLAVAKSSNPDHTYPIVVFTRPTNVYQNRNWLATVALENAFTAIHDFLVIRDHSNGLDKIIVSSQEGINVAWYSERIWHIRSFQCNPSGPSNSVRSLKPVRSKIGEVVSFVTFETARNCVLSVYNLPKQGFAQDPIESITWNRSILDEFSAFQECSFSIDIQDIICTDIDGDGLEEIFIALNSSIQEEAGIYCYSLEDGHFQKYKISDKIAKKLTFGQYINKNITDFVSLSDSLFLFRNALVTSQIRPAFLDSRVVLHIPRIPLFIEEVDMVDVAGYIQSLILLPPNSSFSMLTDGSNAIKVLCGSVGWIDTRGVLNERSRIAAVSGCVTSMLVESREEYVRSSDDGAVFVRLRPSKKTTDSNLRAHNCFPHHFPSEICNIEFLWTRACCQSWFPSQIKKVDLELFNLTAYEIRYLKDGFSLSETKPIAYIHLWAAAPGVSSGFHSQNISPLSTALNPNQYSYSIKASLSNPTGAGALRICQDYLDQSTSYPVPSQLTRAKTVVIPALHELGPFWRRSAEVKITEDIDEEQEYVTAKYPWHEWVAGPAIKSKSKQNARPKYDVCITFDFQSCILPAEDSKDSRCIIV